MYESTDNEQKNEEHADSDGNDEYEQRICPEEKHSVARLTDDSMTWAVENSMSERSEALLSRGMLWLAAPCVLFARQVTSVCSRRPTSRVPVVMEPRTCSSVLGTTLSASMNWTVLGGLESTMHSHFMVVIATSKRQEELAWTSGASGKAKAEKMWKVWLFVEMKLRPSGGLTQHIQKDRTWFAASFCVTGSTVQCTLMSGDILQHKFLSCVQSGSMAIVPLVAAHRRVSVTGAGHPHRFTFPHRRLVLDLHVHRSICTQPENVLLSIFPS